MFSKRTTFVRTATNSVMAIGLLVVLMFSSVGPAFAATGGTILSIVPAAQGSALTYGTAGSASFQVAVQSSGAMNNVVFNAAGLPTGASWAFNPKQLSFTAAQTKTTTLTITTLASTPAVSNRPITIGYKVAGKAGTTTGTASLTINKAMLGVHGTLVLDKVYDGNTTALLAPGCTATITTNCASLSGALAGDVVWLVTTGATGTFAAAAAGAEDATVANLSLSGASSGNYAVPASVPSGATIFTAPLQVMGANAFHYTLNPDAPIFSATYNGFVNGETASVIPDAPTCGVSDPSVYAVPGTYPIVCSGGSGGNYAFSYVNDPNQGGGVLTVSASDAVPTDISLSNSSVAERLAAGAFVGNLSTTDAERILGETYSYSLPTSVVLGCDGSDNGSFQVASDKSNGPVALQTAAVFHYVTKSSYSICVETNDGTNTFDKHFTVNVQPSKMTVYSQGVYDGWVRQSAPGSKVGGTMNSGMLTTLVGDDNLNRQYRSILSFATGGLPDNATIYGITLRIKKASISNSNLFTMLSGLHLDVVKPSFGATSLQLTDFMAPAGATNACLFNPVLDSKGWYNSYGACPKALSYINKTGFTQFRLYFGLASNKNGVANTLSFYSGNSGAASQPQLIITYSVP